MARDTVRVRLSTLKLPQQSIIQWSRVLRSGGPNHSKSSRVHVLGDRLARQAKRLSPFLILGFKAGAFCHPAGEFPLRQTPCEAENLKDNVSLLYTHFISTAISKPHPHMQLSSRFPNLKWCIEVHHHSQSNHAPNFSISKL
jgi:hypothetical protein